MFERQKPERILQASLCLPLDPNVFVSVFQYPKDS
jgi:hypothetical protein